LPQQFAPVDGFDDDSGRPTEQRERAKPVRRTLPRDTGSPFARFPLYRKHRWKKRARAQLAAEPLCRLCLERGIVTPATIADHVEPHKGDVIKFWFGALQSLCKQCHDSPKRNVELHGYHDAIGDDGWPLDPKHPSNRGIAK
jgi:5-methylcytosine-specific restriction endonuclease McrA